MTQNLRNEVLRQKTAHLKGLLKSCALCPRQCGIDRTMGAGGFCRLSDGIMVDCAVAHYGEEPPLTGTHGAGTIFFSSCNLRCIYCQNYQISHGATGEFISEKDLARMMLTLQDQRCHNIDLVTPTPQLPQIMEALHDARRIGLTLPVIYNCGGYERPEIIRYLDGMIDIYLPDFKYGTSQEGFELSDAKDYPQFAVDSVMEMVKQVGDCLETDNGIAVSGIIIRHLVLPGRLSNSIEVLKLIKRHISLSVPITIMSQYTPIPPVAYHSDLGRRLTQEEYNTVVEKALDMGFENLFVQQVDERTLIPNFQNTRINLY
jgi:putative pyruvate formate lyase activating enzyme